VSSLPCLMLFSTMLALSRLQRHLAFCWNLEYKSACSGLSGFLFSKLFPAKPVSYDLSKS
jgi:hypothetical protein